MLEGGQRDVHHPGRGRRGAPQGPAEAHRLAGDHPGHGVAGGDRAGQPFDLGAGVPAGVHGDAALGPAVGDVDQGALPGHPHRQGTDLVEIDLRAVAHPALGRAPGDVVLDPVAGQHLHRPVVTAQRDAHGHLPPRARQQGVQTGLVVQGGHGGGQLRLGIDQWAHGVGGGTDPGQGRHVGGHGGRFS